MNNKGFANSRDTSSELIRSERNNQTLKTRIAELETTLRLAGPRERARYAAVIREHLKDHYLAGIECDHERAMDRPSCACSLVDLGWHENVGAAVEAWLDHALGGSG